MGRKSVKEDKTVYQTAREEKGWSREKAGEMLETISPARLEKIENEKTQIYPEEVVRMAEVYSRPELCNRYCTEQCAIGRQVEHKLVVRNLSNIVLQMLSTLDDLNQEKARLVEISLDDQVTQDEVKDFLAIKDKLEEISITADTLKLWLEEQVAAKKITVE